MKQGSINLIRIPGTELVQYGGKIYAMTLVENNPIVNRTPRGVYLDFTLWPDKYKGEDVEYMCARIHDQQLASSFSDEKRHALQSRIGMVFSDKRTATPARVVNLPPDSVIKVNPKDGDEIKPL